MARKRCANADVIFICVGTPPTETGEADLSAIDNVARLIAKESRTPKLVIEKSTVPAQTGEQLKRALQVYATNPGAKFRVASNPEFLREGTAVEDFFHPDRIVIGVEEKESEQQLRELYRPILEGRFRCPVHQPNCPPAATPDFVVTTIASAELIKHASNSFLGLKISYANVLADLCERLGGNVEEVTRAVGLDPRIGGQFLKAGLGFGGFCLPKDIQAFIKLADRAGVDFGLLKEAERVNKQRVDRLLEKVKKALWVMKGKQIGVLGIAFKPNTDDIRLAPAIEVIRRLAGGRRGSPRDRSGSHGAGARRVSEFELQRGPLRSGARSRRAAGAHRVGAVPAAGLEARSQGNGAPAGDRRPEHAAPGGDERAGI